VSGAAAARPRGSARYESPPTPPRASPGRIARRAAAARRGRPAYQLRPPAFDLLGAHVRKLVDVFYSRRSMFRPNSLAVSIGAWHLSEIFASFHDPGPVGLQLFNPRLNCPVAHTSALPARSAPIFSGKPREYMSLHQCMVSRNRLYETLIVGFCWRKRPSC
jgi:hypothetical protein